MIESQKKASSLDVILLMVYSIVGMSKLFPILNTISIYIVFAGLLWCIWKNQLYKIAPLFIFFNSSILFYAGTAITDLYFATYILVYIIKKPQIHISANNMLLAGFCLYCVFIVSAYSLQTAIAIILSFLALAFLLEELSDYNKWIKFCKWYIVALLAATLYGIGNYIDGISSNIYSTFRYTVTFTDSNYAGFFLSAGLYMAFFLKKELNAWIRWFVICVSLISILITISSSAIIANVCIISIIYLTGMNKKINTRIILKTVVFIVAGLLIINWSRSIFPGAERTFSRFMEKILQFQNGGIDDATTERSIIWKEHLEFFWNQDNFLQILFGGNYLTDRGMDYSKFSIVSHQVYIDALICFGVVGTVVYIMFIFRMLIKKWNSRKLSNTNQLSFVLLLLWIIYSFVLSMFPFWGFMLFLMIDIRNEVSTHAY